MTLQKTSRALLAALLMAAVFPCAPGLDEPVRSWPLALERDRGQKRVRIAIPPILDYQRAGDTWDFKLRPLFWWHRQEDGERNATFLWPLFSSRYVPEESADWRVPIFMRRTRYLDGSGSHFEFMPLWVGHTPGRGEEIKSSWGLFPVAGRWERKLGRDEIRFFLFPLYASSRIGRRSYEYWLWPLFARYKVDGKTVGGRFWPFYGRSENAGVRKTFVLWPFAHDQSGPGERGSWFFPIAGRFESAPKSEKAFLWPFFTRYRDVDKKGRTQIIKNYPWPFLRSLSIDGKQSAWEFWPLWGWSDIDGVSKHFVLWPLLSQRYVRKAGEDKPRLEVTRFLTHVRTTRVDPVEGTLHSRLFWPFFESATITPPSGPVESGWGVLALWPFAHHPGVDALYSPVYHLLSYHRTGAESHFRLLWGLVRLDRTQKRRTLGLLFLNLSRPVKNPAGAKAPGGV